MADPIYPIKWVRYKDYDIAIVTQNQNGPCPLIAICNILFLRRHIRVDRGVMSLTYDELVEKVGEYVLEMVKMRGQEDDPNTQYAIKETLNLLPSLSGGMDINVKFGGIEDCELGAGVCCFDLFGIKLVHGWLPSPDATYYDAVKTLSYNTLVEAVINKNDEVQKPEDDRDADVIATGAAADEYLQESSGQLTYQGLFELVQNIGEDELCVLFRNNHFSTLTKRKGKLYNLLTDVGYRDVRNVVWETLEEIDGDNTLVDGTFERPRDLGRQQRVFDAAGGGGAGLDNGMLPPDTRDGRTPTPPGGPPGGGVKSQVPPGNTAGAGAGAGETSSEPCPPPRDMSEQEAADAALAVALYEQEKERAAAREQRRQQQQQQQRAAAYPPAPYQQQQQQHRTAQQQYPPAAGMRTDVHPQERQMQQYRQQQQQQQQRPPAKRPAKPAPKAPAREKDSKCIIS